MSRAFKDTEHELRQLSSLHLTLTALRESLREGSLGKHLPRMFAPRRLVADAESNFLNVITLAGVKKGSALFEIRSIPSALVSTRHHATSPIARFRYDIAEKLDGTPWFRALVPLEGTLAGASIQLRQPHAFNPYDVGFISSTGGERRGIASRHFTNWAVSNGSAHFYLPAIRATTSVRHSDGYFALPVDSYLNVRMESLNAGDVAVPVVYGPLLKGTNQLAADRIIRKKMRDSADDIASRIRAALAMLDIPKGTTDGHLPVALALQDMLGMTNHHPDFCFKTECESVLGRELTPWQTVVTHFTASVVAGAVHTGTRTPLYTDDDASLLVRCLQSFSETLKDEQDKVFQNHTIFSSKPVLSPSLGDFQLLSALTNLTSI